MEMAPWPVSGIPMAARTNREKLSKAANDNEATIAEPSQARS